MQLQFSYTGPKPSTLPQWMEKTYDLNMLDVLGLLEQQLASTEFEGQFEYAPFQEFDFNGDHVYSHLMSAFWANCEADMIAEDPQTYGAMLVPIFSGSNKTTVLVATGHQEYVRDLSLTSLEITIPPSQSLVCHV
ncbi:hypothetical protein L208DRAFT_1327316 [Tricholoma matsutake]|nr:hypothetical protein L208DRAFT_1327316 [Tricholoma matsutake 945]